MEVVKLCSCHKLFVEYQTCVLLASYSLLQFQKAIQPLSKAGKGQCEKLSKSQCEKSDVYYFKKGWTHNCCSQLRSQISLVCFLFAYLYRTSESTPAFAGYLWFLWQFIHLVVCLFEQVDGAPVIVNIQAKVICFQISHLRIDLQPLICGNNKAMFTVPRPECQLVCP